MHHGQAQAFGGQRRAFQVSHRQHQDKFLAAVAADQVGIAQAAAQQPGQAADDLIADFEQALAAV